MSGSEGNLKVDETNSPTLPPSLPPYLPRKLATLRVGGVGMSKGRISGR